MDRTHYHLSEDGERSRPCVQMHDAEPKEYLASDWLGGVTLESKVVQHSHTERGISPEEVIRIMRVNGVDCLNEGAHTHQMPVDVGSERVVRRAYPHHHHDVGCLIEAGANKIRPDLHHARRHLTTALDTITALRSQVAQLQRDLERATTTEEASQASLAEVFEFMQSMPAVGPWKTVYDQYVTWLEERVEQAIEEAAHA